MYLYGTGTVVSDGIGSCRYARALNVLIRDFDVEFAVWMDLRRKSKNRVKRVFVKVRTRTVLVLNRATIINPQMNRRPAYTKFQNEPEENIYAINPTVNI